MEKDNRGKPWSDSDHKRLVAMVRRGYTAKYIAGQLGRTELAIVSRAETIPGLPAVATEYNPTLHGPEATRYKENTMNDPHAAPTKPLMIEDVTLVNGTRKERLKPDELLELVRQENRHIEDIEAVGGGSKYLTQQTNRHRENITALLKILDELHAE